MARDDYDDDFLDDEDLPEEDDDGNDDGGMDDEDGYDRQAQIEDMLYDQQYGNGATTAMGVFNVGERIKIVGNTSGHNLPIGTVLTVRAYNGQFVQVMENHLNYYEVDLEGVPLTLADVEKKATQVEGEYLKAMARVDYMKETRVEQLNEAEFRLYAVKKIIASEMSPDDKAKRIEAVYSKN